jgi:hypothetical protein
MAFTLKEFIDDLTDEMESHKEWSNKSIKFQTANRQDLEYLSIYEDGDGDICIDIGEADE